MIFKVQDMYKESLTIFSKNEPHPVMDMIKTHRNEIKPLPDPKSIEFTRIFSSPTTRSDIIRALHPDLVAGILAAILVYMIYITSPQQNSLIYFLGGILTLGIILYFSQRKKIMDWYLQTKKEVEEPAVTPSEALQHWAKLYYCARDGIVFEPGRDDQIPLDEMKSFLFRKQD